ncbi:hypothetical protein DKX38_026326 [Salix brachista]|uniref:AMMECR1 domain-containing protein n=1 Tax=Salix brachista TaxID=2182728 RepID=A0A5N5K421_9ROSI|nr:hypothetical protein DKX38_026326 [Salix brachista]
MSEVGKHGFIIEFTDPNNNARRSATYLPEVAAYEGWTREEAIDSLIHKAGYSGHITDSLRKILDDKKISDKLVTNGKRTVQKKGGLKALQVLTSVLLSHMGKIGAKDLLTKIDIAIKALAKVANPLWMEA